MGFVGPFLWWQSAGSGPSPPPSPRPTVVGPRGGRNTRPKEGGRGQANELTHQANLTPSKAPEPEPVGPTRGQPLPRHLRRDSPPRPERREGPARKRPIRQGGPTEGANAPPRCWPPRGPPPNEGVDRSPTSAPPEQGRDTSSPRAKPPITPPPSSGWGLFRWNKFFNLQTQKG